MDLMTLRPHLGYRYILCVICYFSKWVELVPLKDKSAATVSWEFYKLNCRHGTPSVIITDQGTEFQNSTMNEMCRMTGTEHRITSAYHPQVSQSVIEFILFDKCQPC